MIRPTPLVVVTGGSGGLGRATCVALGGLGASVVVSGRSRPALDCTVAEVRLAGGVAHPVRADVRREEDVERLFRITADRFGPVTGVVMAAGVSGQGPVPRPVAQTTLEEWCTVLETNLRGVFLVARAAFAAMRDGGGDLVTIVSARAGTHGHPYAAAYSASKQAVAGLSLALAREGESHGIRVQALFPDAIDTPMLASGGLAGPRMPPHRVAAVVVDMITSPHAAQLRLPVLTSVAGPHPSTHGLQGRR